MPQSEVMSSVNPSNDSVVPSIPASIPKVFSRIAGLVRSQVPHRPGRPPSQLGVLTLESQGCIVGQGVSPSVIGWESASCSVW